jgi:hypothetical protein
MAALVAMEFRWYQIPADPARQEAMIDAATQFMDSVDRREPPEVRADDGHMETYRAVRALHPDVSQGPAELIHDEAEDLVCLVADEQDAATAARAYKSWIIARYGFAARYLDAIDGSTVATTVNSPHGPYLKINPRYLKEHTTHV